MFIKSIVLHENFSSLNRVKEHWFEFTIIYVKLYRIYIKYQKRFEKRIFQV